MLYAGRQLGRIFEWVSVVEACGRSIGLLAGPLLKLRCCTPEQAYYSAVRSRSMVIKRTEQQIRDLSFCNVVRLCSYRSVYSAFRHLSGYP